MKNLYRIILFTFLVLFGSGYISELSYSQELIEKAKTAKIGDILSRSGSIELKKYSAEQITAKIYSSPQWDMTGEPLVKYDANTGRITAKSRYVRFIPDELTGKLEVKKDISNTGTKEFYTIPDSKTTKLSWTVDTDASRIEWNKNNETLIFHAFNDLVMFKVPPPVAWDADNKPVEINITYADNKLTYEITENEYAYPITVDPNTIITTDATGLSGYLMGMDASSYVNARNLATASLPDAATPNLWFGQGYIGATWRVYRSFLTFNTQTIGNANIDSAKVVTVLNVNNSDTDFDFELVSATFDDVWSKTWFNDFTGWTASGAYSVVPLSNTINTSTFVAQGDTIRFILNAAGKNAINKSGNTKFFLESLEDINSSDPGQNYQELIQFYADVSYIEIYYTTISNSSTRSILSKDGIITPYSINGVITPLKSP